MTALSGALLKSERFLKFQVKRNSQQWHYTEEEAEDKRWNLQLQSGF